ncbi:MAG: hypothetical protein U0559_00310 [Anaerolineae bacterium]
MRSSAYNAVPSGSLSGIAVEDGNGHALLHRILGDLPDKPAFGAADRDQIGRREFEVRHQRFLLRVERDQH